MEYFVTENDAYSALNAEKTNQYSSPLVSRHTQEEHYNGNTTTYKTPYKPKQQDKYSGKCDVCDLKLNSYQQSKAHLEGKQHLKKVKAQEVKEQQVNVKQTGKQQQQDEEVNAAEPPSKKARTNVTSLYCNACDLTFTSEAHAKDHYLGRNHERAMHGLAPYTKGYFNTDTNKWQRAFHCETCNCSLTCQQQLDAHLAGIKHKKALKRLETTSTTATQGGGGPAPVGDGGEAQPQPPQTPAEVAARKAAKTARIHELQEQHKAKFSCRACSIYSNSEQQFKHHMDSKKHNRKLTGVDNPTSDQQQQHQQQQSQQSQQMQQQSQQMQQQQIQQQQVQQQQMQQGYQENEPQVPGGENAVMWNINQGT